LGPRKFAEKHNLDIPAIVRRLNLKPTIRVEASWFVVHLDDQTYVLGKTEAGIGPAVREALQLCREVRLSDGRSIQHRDEDHPHALGTEGL
jgi:hypothetical protein